MPKDHANKFLANIQATNAKFTFDALFKFVTRTITLLEGGILPGGGMSKGAGATTHRTNRENVRQVNAIQSALSEEKVSLQGCREAEYIYSNLHIV